MGVPLFLFITGYLLLDRQYDSTSCLKFWKKNCFQLFIVNEIWVILYNIVMACFYGQAVEWKDVVCNLLLLKQVALPHMWYMPMILGLYLFIPMISVLLKTFDFVVWKAVLLILIFFGFGTTVIDLFYKSLHDGLSLGMNAVFPVFMGGIYGVYIVLGYFVKKGLFQKTPIWKLVAWGGLRSLQQCFTSCIFMEKTYSTISGIAIRCF